MKKKVILDILFYVGIPLIMWNNFRPLFGDYYTILLGTIPAVIYAAVVFIRERQWNVTGIFFFSLVILNLLMNLLSTTAEEQLWNGVWIDCFLAVLYTVTLLMRRPLGMYLFIDYAYARGIPREKSRALYSSRPYFHHFVKFTLFLMLREIIMIVMQSALITQLGINGFNTIKIADSILNLCFTGLMIYYVTYIIKQIRHGNKVATEG